MNYLGFVGQLAPDICRKIQKIDGFARNNRSELLEIVQKVFDGKDSKEDVLAEKMEQATMAI